MKKINLKKRLLSFVFAASLFFPFAVQAQSYVGTAYGLGDGCHILTPYYGGRGAVWFGSKIDLNYSFSLAADLFLGFHDAGADGIVFVLQDVGCDALGWYGEGQGFWTLGAPSLGVEFDTYYNGNQYDPADGSDHVAIMKNGSVSHSGVNSLASPVTVADLEDGFYHHLDLSWDAFTQTLSVSLNYNPVISYTGDIVNQIFGGLSTVYWGFTAATGGSVNLQTVCNISLGVACGNNGDKVQICHIPSGNPENPNTICVSQSALADHLAHGDFLGSCNMLTPCSSNGSQSAGYVSNFLEETPQMALQPNPANEQVVIALDGFEQQSLQISIMDNVGRRIYQQEVDIDHALNVPVNLADFSPGVYFVSLHAEGLAPVTQKLVVER